MSPPPNFAGLQLALFFKDSIDAPEELWLELKKTSLSKIFDKTPIIVPLPEDSQLDDAPAVTLTSKNLPHRISIARKRGDIHWLSSEKDHRSFQEVKDELYGWMETFFNALSNRAEIVRVGYIHRFFFETDNAADVAAKMLDSKARLLSGGGTMHEVSVKIVTRERIEDFEINNNSSVVMGEKTAKEGKVKGIMLTRDFNTVAEKQYQFTWEKLKGFCTETEKKMNVDGFSSHLWQ